MAIVETVYEFNNPRKPKCRACSYFKGGVVGKCISESTKVKSRNRYHNSKACIEFKLAERTFL